MGLDAERLAAIDQRAGATTGAAGGARQAVMVAQCWGHTSAGAVFADGDVLLAVDGRAVDTVRDIDAAIHDAALIGDTVKVP